LGSRHDIGGKAMAWGAAVRAGGKEREGYAALSGHPGPSPPCRPPAKAQALEASVGSRRTTSEGPGAAGQFTKGAFDLRWLGSARGCPLEDTGAPATPLARSRRLAHALRPRRLDLPCITKNADDPTSFTPVGNSAESRRPSHMSAH
jgi:hypothetical protein